MLRDISDWEHIGHGGNSTLPKEELKSPENKKYLIKYPRIVEVGVTWEDITEHVAANIALILGLESMEVEIVNRNSRRGCLLKNFVAELEPIASEEGGSLLAIFDDYDYLLENDLKGYDLLVYGFNYIHRLPYWNSIKRNFIEMLFFDVLIGNQDRHPFNWMVLFYPNDKISLSPIYDNGASLGFRFDDSYLLEMVQNQTKTNKYMKNTMTKAGIFEKKQVKAKQLLNYLLNEYPEEAKSMVTKISNFNINEYINYINSLSFINEYQKLWLLKIIPFRRNKILQWIKEKEGES